MKKALVDPSFLSVEASQSHWEAPHSVGVLWASDQPVADASLPVNTQPSQETNIQVPINYVLFFIRETFLMGWRLLLVFTFSY